MPGTDNKRSITSPIGARYRLVTLTLVLLLVVPSAGCQSYGDISDTAYEYAKALYSATNRKSIEQLTVAKQQIERVHHEGRMSDRERKWLQAIIRDAESGSWSRANQACRRMMEEQIGIGK